METTLDARTTDERLLEEANLGFIRSVRTSDVAWFEESLAPDFFNGNPDGTVAGRAQFLANVARPFPLADFDCRDVRIRILGDTAIVQGRTVYRKPEGGRAEGRYTDIWVRRGSRWLCIAADVIRG